MKISGCMRSIFCCLEKLNFVPILLTRLTIAGIFIGSGYGKLTHIEKVISFFTSLGLPSAHFLAPFTAVFELVCGILILIGFATRFAAVPLIIIMVVAIQTAKSEDISGVASLFKMSEYLYIVLLVWLLVYGAGKISVDYFMKCKIGKLCSKSA